MQKQTEQEQADGRNQAWQYLVRSLCLCRNVTAAEHAMKEFCETLLPNTREEQTFSIVKNLQVTVISKVFYKYSFVSGRHLFPANTTRCDATGSLRSGSGLSRKLIFCSYTHLVKAKHMYSPRDSDGNSLVAWVYPHALISPFCLFSESMLPRYSVPEFLPQCGILLFDIWSLFHVYNNFVSVIPISAFTFLDVLGVLSVVYVRIWNFCACFH